MSRLLTCHCIKEYENHTHALDIDPSGTTMGFARDANNVPHGFSRSKDDSFTIRTLIVHGTPITRAAIFLHRADALAYPRGHVSLVADRELPRVGPHR